MRQRLIESLETRNPQPEAIVMLSLSEKLLLTEHAVQKGIRVFWLEHDRVGRWLSKNPWLPMLRALSNQATTICVSELSRKIFLELGWSAEKTVAIANGIVPSPGRATRPPSPAATGEGSDSVKNVLRLGCVARLSPEKGIDLLIQAVGRMPEIDLTIVGKGPDENYLRQIIDHIHRTEMVDTERIRIVPRVDDLAGFYGSIDALVLPSRDNDPFGLVAAEAMTAGTPVIVTDQCGIAGYLNDGTDAMIVRADSDEELRKGILRIMNPDIRRRLADAGKKTATEKFSVELMVTAYERLLRA